MTHGFIARLIAPLLGMLLLAGCAGLTASHVSAPPRDALDNFELDGRFSLYQESRNYSGRLSWKHTTAGNEMMLSSPFGQGIAEIITEKSGARLTTGDGKVYAAPDAEVLTLEVLGYALPLTQLADWVRGRGVTGDAKLDELGRLTALHHQAWNIDYDYNDRNPQSPPIRIVAKRGEGFELRLFIDEWRSLSTGEDNP